MDRIGLAELIQLVTEELRSAERNTLNRIRYENRGADDRVMQFDECELEVAIEVEKGGAAGTKLWVLKLGGSLKKTDKNTIRVKFKPFAGRPSAAAFPGEDPDVDEGPPLGQDEPEDEPSAADASADNGNEGNEDEAAT